MNGITDEELGDISHYVSNETKTGNTDNKQENVSNMVQFPDNDEKPNYEWLDLQQFADVQDTTGTKFADAANEKSGGGVLYSQCSCV